MLTRIMVSLDGKERSALNELAESERRDPRAQAALIIRESLKRRGLLRVKTPVEKGEHRDC